MFRILIDTNILIPAEDNAPLPKTIADLFAALNDLGADLYVHEASLDDVKRDANESRRQVSLSKYKKYKSISKTNTDHETLESRFGPIKNQNDLADCQILNSVYLNSVDILITSDKGIFKRVRDSEIQERVFRPDEAIAFLDPHRRVERLQFRIKSTSCDLIDPVTPILKSLADDYHDFWGWFSKCQKERRLAWVVMKGSEIASIAILKSEESLHVAGSSFSDVQKICTFKVAQNARGERIGELMMRQILHHLAETRHQCVYMTIFEENQPELVNLISTFGFLLVGYNSRGEGIYLRGRYTATVGRPPSVALKNYPCIYQPADAVIVPIKYQYHRRLFPEASNVASGVSMDLFSPIQSETDHSAPAGAAIRKAYVCKSQLAQIAMGTTIFFYMSKDERAEFSQHVTGVGVAESFVTFDDAKQIITATAKRTVYREEELRDMIRRGPTRVLRFIFSGYFRKPVSLEQLIDDGVLVSHPQSMMRIENASLDRLLARLELTSVPNP